MNDVVAFLLGIGTGLLVMFALAWLIVVLTRPDKDQPVRGESPAGRPDPSYRD